jgi:hypothetical protein
MLREAPRDVVLSGVGDVFAMKMHNDEMGDYEMSNEVVEYELNRRTRPGTGGAMTSSRPVPGSPWSRRPTTAPARPPGCARPCGAATAGCPA